MVKKSKYLPIGDTICIASVLVQAAAALDVAAGFAVETKDTAALTQIGMVWLEMAARLEGGDEDYEESEEVTSEHPIGFESNALTEMRKKEQINGATQSYV